MRAESDEVVNLTFTRVRTETFEIGVDAQALIDVVKELAPDIARNYESKTLKEALDWLDGFEVYAEILNKTLTLAGEVEPSDVETEVQDIEHDAEDMAEYCPDHDGTVDDHCDEGHCEDDCTCGDEDEDEEDEDEEDEDEEDEDEDD